MVYKARLLISGRQKVALALLVLLAIAFFAYYPRITEALLAFLLGGVVPGTNMVLSANVMLMILIATFVVCVASLWLRWHLKKVGSKRNFVPIPVKSADAVAIPVTVVESSPTETAIAANGRKQPLRRHHRMSAGMSLIGRKVAYRLHVVGIWGAKAARNTQRTAAMCTRATGSALRQTATFMVFLLFLLGAGVDRGLRALIKVSKISAVYSARATRAMWGWAEPRLRAVDSWLELLVRKVESKAAKKLDEHETVRTVKSMGREYRKSVHELTPKTAAKATAKKVRQAKAKIAAATEN